MGKTIHIFASLGNRKKLASGGGQTSARRLVQILENLEYIVKVINRHVPPYSSDTFFLKVYKVCGIIIDPIIWFFHLLFSNPKNGIALIIGYSGFLFPFYFLFVLIAKILKYKTIFYIKGGFTEKKYESFPHWLQMTYKKGLYFCDIALYEGEVGTTISKNTYPKTEAVWLPNYIENNFAPVSYPKKNKDAINLIYFGRIHPSKNILLVVDVFEQIYVKFHNVSLTIVGSGSDNFERIIADRIGQSPYNSNINRMPRQSHQQLKKILSSQHFFIFPSLEEQEGHSNSLNEAMSFGLVPIVSDTNFLPSIVGTNRLVAHDMSVETFSNIIIDVIENGDFEKLSQKMYERVKLNFTQEIVEKKMNNIIDQL